MHLPDKTFAPGSNEMSNHMIAPATNISRSQSRVAVKQILSLLGPIYGSEKDYFPPGEAGQNSRPFNDAVDTWRDKGWLGTIPLPYRSKNPPPTGWTGRNAGFPTESDVDAWRREAKYERGNIGLRLGWPVEISDEMAARADVSAPAGEYELMGIDVDHYDDTGRQKLGGDQLDALVRTLGALPPTYVSTARARHDDGSDAGDWTSGIRLFLVPRGLAFRGQADADIEVIQKNHRFAVVWPSYNPKTNSTYRLYSPTQWAEHGQALDPLNGDDLPDPATLPLLPDKWVDHLTQGRMRDDGGEIDMDATPDEVDHWAIATFRDGDELCTYMRQRVRVWTERIHREATSHDKIRDAHWNLYRLAAEGHTGWRVAVDQINRVWTDDVIARDKREADDLRREVFRSRMNALRKIKATNGSQYVTPTCVCPTEKSNMNAPQQNNGTKSGGRSADQIHSGQIRMAHRLAKAQANRLLYVHGIGWHYWDRTRWQSDDGEARVKRAAMKVIAESITQTIGNPSDQAKRLRSDARKCESASGLDGMIRIARALKPFAATVADIDADPYLLNVANGTVDLRTGELSAHNPADRITKVCRGAYLADADDPARFGTNWTAFLERVQPDDDMRGFAQRLIGVGLIGRIVEHILPILVGTGANGKSVFCEAIQFALGDYAITAEPDLLMHRDGGHPTGEMDLRGCRWVIVSESEKDRRLAETTVKRLTADATVRARRMRQDFVEFKASHTLMLVTNHKPKVSGDDQAIWRRLRVVPFNVQIPRVEQDTGLGEKLQLEADAVISWAIAGLVAYWQRGLDEPRQVQSATAMYHRESDAIGRFIADRCITGPKHKVEPKRLHAAWRVWQADDGCEAVGLHAFNAAMEERGYATGKPSNGKRWRHGIGLAADDPSSQT